MEATLIRLASNFSKNRTELPTGSFLGQAIEADLYRTRRQAVQA